MGTDTKMNKLFISLITIFVIAGASVGVYFAISGSSSSKTPTRSDLEKGQYIAYVANNYEENQNINVHKIENDVAGKPKSYSVVPKDSFGAAHYLVYNKFYDVLEFITLESPSPYKPRHFYVSMKDGSTTKVKDSYYVEAIRYAGVEYVSGVGTVMFCGQTPESGIHQTTATTQISTIDGQAPKILPNLPGWHRSEPATTEDGGRVYLAGGWYYDYLHPTPPDGNHMMSDIYMMDFNF